MKKPKQILKNGPVTQTNEEAPQSKVFKTGIIKPQAILKTN